jgi:hypothetical protein
LRRWRRVWAAAFVGVRACMLIWAQEREQTGPSACAVQRQAETGRQGGGAELQRARPDGEAAVERRRAWSGHKGGLRSIGPSATGRAGPRGAHRGLRSTGEAAQGSRRQGPSSGDGQRSWGRSMQGVSGLLIPTGQFVILLRRCHRGSEGRRATGGEESRARSNSPAVVLGWNSGATRVGIMREELGKLPGVEGKLSGGLVEAGVRRSGRSTAGQ